MKKDDNAPKRPLARYPGAKWRQAAMILAWVPDDHDLYGLPYGGSMTTLLRKPRSPMEAYNDKSEGMCNLLRQLRERRDDLIALIEATHYSAYEHRLSFEPTDDPLERARRMYVRLMMSMYPFDETPSLAGYRRQKKLSRGKDGNKKMKPAAVSFMGTDHLYDISARLRGVQIENWDGLRFIREYDNPRNFFMVDPPYLGDTRQRSTIPMYEHEMMTPEKHTKLADVLLGIEGMCLICGYQSALYRELYEEVGWLRVDAPMRVNSEKSVVESIWVSPRTVAQLDKERDVAAAAAKLAQEERDRLPLLAAIAKKGV